MHFAVQKDVFLALKYGKTRCGPGPRWGSLQRSPDPLVGWGGGGHPSPDPTPLSAFGASIERLRRSILAFPLLLIYEMTTGGLSRLCLLFRFLG